MYRALGRFLQGSGFYLIQFKYIHQYFAEHLLGSFLHFATLNKSIKNHCIWASAVPAFITYPRKCVDDRSRTQKAQSSLNVQPYKLWDWVSPHKSPHNTMHYLGSGQLLHCYCDKNKLNVYQIGHIFVGKTLRSFFIFLLSTVLFSSVIIPWMHKTSHCFPNMSGFFPYLCLWRSCSSFL